MVEAIMGAEGEKGQDLRTNVQPRSDVSFCRVWQSSKLQDASDLTGLVLSWYNTRILKNDDSIDGMEGEHQRRNACEGS